MEGWKNLAIRQFDNSTMEDWKIGKMEEWKNLAIRQFDNSTMEDWKIGKMEDWKNGRMEKWKDGKIWQFGISIIRIWKNGRLINSCRLLTSSSRQTPYAIRFFFTAYWPLAPADFVLPPPVSCLFSLPTSSSRLMPHAFFPLSTVLS